MTQICSKILEFGELCHLDTQSTLCPPEWISWARGSSIMEKWEKEAAEACHLVHACVCVCLCAVFLHNLGPRTLSRVRREWRSQTSVQKTRPSGLDSDGEASALCKLTEQGGGPRCHTHWSGVVRKSYSACFLDALSVFTLCHEEGFAIPLSLTSGQLCHSHGAEALRSLTWQI